MWFLPFAACEPLTKFINSKILFIFVFVWRCLCWCCCFCLVVSRLAFVFETAFVHSLAAQVDSVSLEVFTACLCFFFISWFVWCFSGYLSSISVNNTWTCIYTRNTFIRAIGRCRQQVYHTLQTAALLKKYKHHNLNIHRRQKSEMKQLYG